MRGAKDFHFCPGSFKNKRIENNCCVSVTASCSKYFGFMKSDCLHIVVNKKGIEKTKSLVM
jgi:hypothetical protein